MKMIVEYKFHKTFHDFFLLRFWHLIPYIFLKSYHQGDAPLIFVKIKTYSIDTLNFYQTSNIFSHKNF